MTRFVDTNVLIYAACTTPGDENKRELARALLLSDDLAPSTQVLQEFYWQATHSQRVDRISHQDAREHIRDLRRLATVPLTLEVVDRAIDLTERFRIAYWDAAILAAASLGDCDTVLTEDLNDGQDYDGIRVVNPFAGAGAGR